MGLSSADDEFLAKLLLDYWLSPKLGKHSAIVPFKRRRSGATKHAIEYDDDDGDGGRPNSSGVDSDGISCLSSTNKECDSR